MLLSFEEWLVTVPVWMFAGLLFGGMFAASVTGIWLRKCLDRRKGADEKTRDEEGGQQALMVSSVMGLLALLVGFTFSMAVDRYDARRINVLYEANTIGTTYLRSQLLEEPHRARLSKLLVEYTDVRIDLATATRRPDAKKLSEKSDRLIADLWTATVAAFPSMRPYDFSNSYLQAMNALIDMDSARRAGRSARVPSEVFLVLLLYQFVAAGVVSYVLVRHRGRGIAIFLFVLFGIAFLLVLDIDRPTSGGIKESQLPMLQLRAFLKDHPPESFDRLNLPAEARTGAQ
jgi:hypothetical protein